MLSTESQLIKTLYELVSCPTVENATDAITNCFDFVESSLMHHGLPVNRFNSKGYQSLVATTQVTHTPKVLLQAHLDVVPAKAQSFELVESDGKLIGRGVFDMKFAAACYLQLVKDLASELDGYDFGIMFTSDEEVGGENGVKYLLDKGYGGNVCVLPDGGNDWQIETTCNGVWQVRVSANGKSAHGSRPWEGNNAINNLVDGLSEIHDLFGALKPHQSSITISQISGGAAVNQVPDYAEAAIDMRFVSNAEYEAYRKAIELITSKRKITINTIAQCSAGSIDLERDEIKEFLEVAEKVNGKPLGQGHSFGASDARYFSEKNIPTIVIRPAGGGAHSNHEWIDKNELLKFYKILKTYIMRATKIS